MKLQSLFLFAAKRKTRSLSIIVGACAAASAMASPARAADSVLILGGTSGPTGDAEEIAAQNVLEAGGHTTVTIGPSIVSFTGTGLSSYNAVLLLDGDVASDGYDMPAAGQTALLSFINGGGGLVTAEWSVWGADVRGYSTTLAGAFPVTPTSTYDYATPLSYNQLTSNTTLNQGVASSFSFTPDDYGGTETQFVPKNGATAYYGSSGGDSANGLIGWNYGSGRVISFSTLIGPDELGNANYAQLVSNSVYWSEGAVPEPACCSLLGVGALGLLARRRRA